jgi:uncharacterized membrane protein
MAASSASGLRIGDAERQEAVELLAEQYAVGRLTREEFDERSDAATSARTFGDLTPLFADLPVRAPGAVAGPGPSLPGRPVPAYAGRVAGLRRVLVPLFFVLVAITIVTHLPFVLIAVGLWFVLGRRHWQHHHGWQRARGWTR